MILLNSAFGYYDDILKHQDAILFLSHPDCDICKKKLEVWQNVKEKHVEKKIILDYVDCKKHATFCDKHQVDQYPTILFNIGKDWTKFLQPQTEESIDNFIQTFPELCRFPNDLSGCHSSVIDWTQNNKAHKDFDYKKEAELLDKKLFDKIKEMQNIVHEKYVLTQKETFVEYLTTTDL